MGRTGRKKKSFPSRLSCRSRPPAHVLPVLAKARTVPQPLQTHHEDEDGRAQRRGRGDARRSRRPRRRARRARGPRGAVRAPVRRRRPGRSAGRDLRPRSRTSSCSGISAVTSRPTTRRSSSWPARFTCRSWRLTACASRHPRAVRCSTCSRASITTGSRPRRTALAERRAISEGAGRHGGALRRQARCGRRTRELADRLQYDGGSRLQISRLPGAAGRGAGELSPQDHEVGARERYRPYHDRARRSRASSISSRSSSSPATSSSSGTSSISAGSTTSSCRARAAPPTAPSATASDYGRRSRQMDLLFERFLSEEAGVARHRPDLRAATGASVIQHVYEKPASFAPR